MTSCVMTSSVEDLWGFRRYFYYYKMVYRRRYAARRKALRRIKRRSSGGRTKRRGTPMAGRPSKRARRFIPRTGYLGSIRSLVPTTRVVRHVYQFASSPDKYGDSGTGDLKSGTMYTIAPFLLANSAYDPDTAVSGIHNVSAALYNYMSKLYTRNEVLACKAVFTFSQATTSNPDVDIGFVVRLDDTGSVYNAGVSFQAMRNDPRNHTAIMHCTPNRDGKVTIKHMWSRKRLTLGQKADNDAASGYNPSTVYHFIPMCGNANDGDSGAMPHISMRVTLYMLCKWTVPRDIPGNDYIDMAQQ